MARVIDARRFAESDRLKEQIDPLYRAAWALCGSPTDAEDLVQDTFARVLARPRRLRRDDEMPYLLATLRDTYLNRLRTLQRRPRTVELPVDESEVLRSTRAEPEAALEQSELLATIAALPDDFRDVIVAVDLVGLSYDRFDATLGEETPDGTRPNWEHPGAVGGHPAHMRDYDKTPPADRLDGNPDEHFNGTILSHAYYRFVQFVGHARAGRVLHNVPSFLSPRPTFAEVAQAFRSRSNTIYGAGVAGWANAAFNLVGLPPAQARK